MAAYESAVQQGIDPESFWRLTPYQARIAMDGLRNGRTILAWQIAVFTRQKKLQPLAQLLKKKQTGPGIIQALRDLKR